MHTWYSSFSLVYIMTTSARSLDWRTGLHQRGLYFEGVIEKSNFDSVLEAHKRDTVSTFGTRTSRTNDKQENPGTKIKKVLL